MRVEVLEDFSALLSWVSFDISMGAEMLFELVPQQEPLATNLTDHVLGSVLVLSFLVSSHPFDGRRSALTKKAGVALLLDPDPCGWLYAA